MITQEKKQIQNIHNNFIKTLTLNKHIFTVVIQHSNILYSNNTRD